MQCNNAFFTCIGSSVVTLPLTLLKDVTLETRHHARWSRFFGINAEKFTERSEEGERRSGKSISSSFYLSPLLSLAMRDRVKRESRAGKEERGRGRDRAVFTTTRKNLFAMVVQKEGLLTAQRTIRPVFVISRLVHQPSAHLIVRILRFYHIALDSPPTRLPSLTGSLRFPHLRRSVACIFGPCEFHTSSFATPPRHLKRARKDIVMLQS